MAIMTEMSPPTMRIISRKLPAFASTRSSEGSVAMSQQRFLFQLVCSRTISDNAKEIDQYVVSIASIVKTEPSTCAHVPMPCDQPIIASSVMEADAASEHPTMTTMNARFSPSPRRMAWRTFVGFPLSPCTA